MDTPATESMFFSDLLPGQWRDLHTPSEQPPMNRLFLAVLEDALRCWQNHQPRPSQSSPKGLKSADGHWRSEGTRTRVSTVLFMEADLWLFHPEIISPFSFDEVCEVLNIEPDYLRAGLLRWRDASILGQAAGKIARRNPHSRMSPTIRPKRRHKNRGRDNDHHPHGGMREVKKTSPYSPLTGHQE